MLCYVMYIKERAFMSNTWNICPLQINLKHLICKFFEKGVKGSTLSFDKILSVKDPLFL